MGFKGLRDIKPTLTLIIKGPPPPRSGKKRAKKGLKRRSHLRGQGASCAVHILKVNKKGGGNCGAQSCGFRASPNTTTDYRYRAEVSNLYIPMSEDIAYIRDTRTIGVYMMSHLYGLVCSIDVSFAYSCTLHLPAWTHTQYMYIDSYLHSDT